MGFYLSAHFSVLIGSINERALTLHCAEATSKLISQARPQLLFTQLWIGSIYPVCLGGCYWLASFVCANRIFLEKKKEKRKKQNRGKEWDGGKEVKRKNNNSKLLCRSSWPLPIVCFNDTFWHHGSWWVSYVIRQWMRKARHWVLLMWTHPVSPTLHPFYLSWNNLTPIMEISTHSIFIHDILFLTTFFPIRTAYFII